MIYLVDDDPIQNLLTSQLIEAASIDVPVKIFNHGEEVMEALHKGGRPDVILLDINMPIMDGWEFLEEYTAMKGKADVYMLTSSSNGEDLARADEFSCVKGYYTKPINVDTIKNIFKS